MPALEVSFLSRPQGPSGLCGFDSAPMTIATFTSMKSLALTLFISTAAQALPASSPQIYAPAEVAATVSVGAGSDLQAALDRAKPGDTIELPSGAVFTGNFVLPQK